MADNGDKVLGTVLTDIVVPPDAPWSAVIERGQHLRIVDLEGRQAVDFLCYNARDAAERYCAADTMKIAGIDLSATGRDAVFQPGQPAFLDR